jgi:two-component system, chemotaxis family, protein-glutamate methylesterase/glutaminase
MSANLATLGAVVIGGSAGAFEPLTHILATLPRDFSLPVVVVIHVAPSRRSLLAEVFGPRCALQVREVDDKEAIEPGNVYVAPPNYHLLIERTGHFALSVDAPVHFSRPSIDVLFESAADAYADSLIGVLLSGANEDGGWGLARIKAAGGTAVVQSLESSQAQTMPAAALRLTQPDYVLPVEDIGPLLVGIDALRSRPEAL